MGCWLVFGGWVVMGVKRVAGYAARGARFRGHDGGEE